MLSQTSENFIEEICVTFSLVQSIDYLKKSSDTEYESSRQIKRLPSRTKSLWKDEIKLVCGQSAESPSRLMGPGESVFDFSFNVPYNAEIAGFATFKHAISEEYGFSSVASIKVTVDRKGMFTKNLKEEIFLKFCPLLGGGNPLLLAEKPRSLDSELSRWWCCSGGKVEILLDRTPLVFFADTMQNICLMVKTDSGQRIKSVKVYLRNSLIIKPIKMIFPDTRRVKIFEGPWNGTEFDSTTSIMSFAAFVKCNIDMPWESCLTCSDSVLAKITNSLEVVLKFDGSYEADVSFNVVLAALSPTFEMNQEQNAISEEMLPVYGISNALK